MNRLRWATALWILVTGGGIAPLHAQVSPGPLARAHQEIEGSLKCTRCHGSGAGGMQARCLSCHRDIAWLAERNRGLHGSPEVKAGTCASCHPDHAGVDFSLVKWVEGASERFNHRRAGWSLEQSHAKLKCADCHKPANRPSPAAKLATGGHSNWTGLEQTCASCHEDVHRGALGVRCTACHDIGKWKVTPGFSHDTTGYELTGKHLQVKCDACHLAPRLPLGHDAAGRPIPVYQPVPHAGCAACHTDVHRGQFGANCAGCHTTRGFTEISGTGFDHAKTSFPLTGRHASVPCASCHRDFRTPQGRRPAWATCATCHSPDPHAGTATVQGKPADCAACHTDRGFSPSTFPVEGHRASKYPLEGKHATVKCSACHTRDAGPLAVATLGSSRVLLRPAFAACTSCHADDHGGQLAARPRKGDCAECHSVAGWSPSAFGPDAHARLRLPLEGRHAEIACRSCHGVDRKGLKSLSRGAPGLGKAGFAFTGIETGCAECHVDPHGGRFGASGPRPVPGGCPACHDARSFRPAAVDVTTHDGFGFRLRGAHRATPCSACHKELAGPPPATPVSTLAAAGGRLLASRFEADSACASCHATVHGTQFDGRKGGSGCERCHGEEGFVPALRFNHDRDASFALGTGHQRLACAACHKTVDTAGGAKQVVYRPLSGKCESCHIRKPG